MMRVMDMLKDSGQLRPDDHFKKLLPGDNVTAGTIKQGERLQLFLTVDGEAVVCDEHGATVHGHDGSATFLRLDGGIERTKPDYERVEIDDLRLVQSYQINRVFQTTLHSIEFVGGGIFSFLFDANGKVLETVERGVKTMYRQRDKTLRVYGSPSEAA